MKKNRLLQCFCATTGLVLLPLSSSAQEDLDPAKMEEIMGKYANPGPQHKALRSWAGVWKAETSYWLQPGGEPMRTKGESTVRLLLKGRFLREQYTSEIPGMGPFLGQGTLAYDRVAKEYVHTWMDNMATSIMISRGKPSKDGKTIEVEAIHKNYMTMQDIKYRTVYHPSDGKTRKMEMFSTPPGQKEYKHMEIIYTKVRGLQKGAGAKTGAAAGAAIGGGQTEKAGEKK